MSKSFPVDAYESQIVSNVTNNNVTIIVGETGSGKTTRIPDMLEKQGYSVVVTQPRRIAAMSVSEYVAECDGSPLGDKVGYATGFEKQYSDKTRILFCTDGLQLVRELTGQGRSQVLIIDEVHEWNLNIETLVACAKLWQAQGWPVKVVLMSATMEAEKLAKYYGTSSIINVPGRLFPVEMTEKDPSEMIPFISQKASEGKNILVFQPGKKEIEETIQGLSGLKDKAVILPLHGDLESSEQKKVFRHYNMPKIVVATNIAQTSITIDDINIVCDTGLERRIELSDGVEGLYLKPISRADCRQRAGRAGRCQEGQYILFSKTPLESKERRDFPEAEIKRSLLDQTVLRLASNGLDAEELEFFHQPDKGEIHRAKKSLYALGAVDENKNVTKIGHLISRLPVGVKYGRMIVEAEKNGCLSDVIIIASILEAGSLRDKSGDWKKITQESNSDLLAELDIYKACKGLRGEEMRALGVFTKSYWRAKEIREKIMDSLWGLLKFSKKDCEDREVILKSCASGMVDHLYKETYGKWKNGDDQERQVDKQSVVSLWNTDWVVGIPRDIEIPGRRGGKITLNLISMVSKIKPEWLIEVAPQLFKEEKGLRPTYDYWKDLCVSTTRKYFNGALVKEDTIEDPSNPEAYDCFVNYLYEKTMSYR